MKTNSRRKILAGLAIGLPAIWVKPVVKSILLPAHAQMSTTTLQFPNPSNGEPFIVPADVTLINVVALGASGGDDFSNVALRSLGGLGGRSEADIIVTPGESLTIIVGGVGTDSTSDGTGVGGIGGGGNASLNSDNGWGAGGGGRSSVERVGTPLVVAGGGGGAGAANTGTSTGGNGGGASGVDGAVGGGTGGGGGSGGVGGAGGSADMISGSPGTATDGGDADQGIDLGGGGGGAGYGGDGAGGGFSIFNVLSTPSASGGGGGGGLAPGGTTTVGVNTGDGMVTITF